MAFLCLTGVPYFLCATNILSLPDGGVNRVTGKPRLPEGAVKLTDGEVIRGA